MAMELSMYEDVRRFPLLQETPHALRV